MTTLVTRTNKPKITLDQRRHVDMDMDQFKSKPIILIKVIIGLIDQSRSVFSDVNDRALVFRSILATLQTCTVLQLSRNGRACCRYYGRSSWSTYFDCADISTKTSIVFAYEKYRNLFHQCGHLLSESAVIWLMER